MPSCVLVAYASRMGSTAVYANNVQISSLDDMMVIGEDIGSIAGLVLRILLIAGRSGHSPGLTFHYENRIRDFHSVFMCLEANHVVFSALPHGSGKTRTGQ